MTNRNMVVLR